MLIRVLLEHKYLLMLIFIRMLANSYLTDCTHLRGCFNETMAVGNFVQAKHYHIKSDSAFLGNIKNAIIVTHVLRLITSQTT